jgi:hypothetical protein
MPFSQTFPPGAPTISGDLITVSQYLLNPPRIVRLIEDLTLNRFISDRLFGRGPTATGGAVLYNQVTVGDFFLGRDVEEITPGAEYPLLTDTAPLMLAAAVQKWGGQVMVTDEDRDRNALNIFQRETRKLANTVVRKVDAVSLAVLAAAPVNTVVAGTSWATATGDQMVANLLDAVAAINNPDMGYVADLVILNPAQYFQLLKSSTFRAAMQAASPDSILRDGIIGTFVGLTFGVSNRVAAGTAYVAAGGGMVGSISDEVPLTTEVYREAGKDSTFIKSGRRTVPVVTDPKAATLISSL